MKQREEKLTKWSFAQAVTFSDFTSVSHFLNFVFNSLSIKVVEHMRDATELSMSRPDEVLVQVRSTKINTSLLSNTQSND